MLQRIPSEQARSIVAVGVRQRDEILPLRQEFAALHDTNCLILQKHERASRVHFMPAMLDPLSSNLERYMDMLSARQKLVASNIANADTPGYKTRDIDFQDEFRNAIDASRPQVAEVSGLKTKNDGNNVNIDRESRLLAENDMRFSIATSLLRSRLKTLRSAIE